MRHTSIDATMRSVSNRQHKEHKFMLSPTLKETTTRLLQHGKHRNWWTHTPETQTTYQPLALNLMEWDHTYNSTHISWFYLYNKSVSDHYLGSSLLCNFLCNFSYVLPGSYFYGISLHMNRLDSFITYRVCFNITVDSRLGPSQWETVLLCNNVSHWLDATSPIG